eukprot:CAMPEP_0179060732 /NCGR_PEP_ID=MMETSP0796-20121207/26016_1 /TAXON_ID=73915 /ORGANISM="Pyrodinium bahamense, Strain pbaha01" /LENGTH=52 /DNA_ID=CAMNT_0020757521 /DNA_START=675 /DNA_END=830 /DNA_ORIENTATION=+
MILRPASRYAVSARPPTPIAPLKAKHYHRASGRTSTVEMPEMCNQSLSQELE